MDRYQRFMTTGKSDFFIPTKKNDLISTVCDGVSKKIIEISFDQFVKVMRENRFPSSLPVHFVIYDENIVTTRDECMLRYQFIKYLNRFSRASFEFFLSDSSLPAYLAFMNSVNWKADDRTNYHMSIDRNPTREKNIPLETARGKLEIPEEKLIWFSDKTLQLLPGKTGSLCLSDAKKLKKFIGNFMDQVDRKYHIQYMNDFDKAYLVYHYLFDCKAFNNIDITPRSISFASKQTVIDRNGVQRLKPSFTHYESRPVGTLEHNKGVCAGQSRLFSSLLCNPEMKVEADSIIGLIPSGEIHRWSNFVINGKIYQCCTTMKGLFANLDSFGYAPYPGQYFTRLYPHSSLSYPEVEKVKQHLKSIRK